jgi:hypothetical protein
MATELLRRTYLDGSAVPGQARTKNEAALETWIDRQLGHPGRALKVYKGVWRDRRRRAAHLEYRMTTPRAARRSAWPSLQRAIKAFDQACSRPAVKFTEVGAEIMRLRVATCQLDPQAIWPTPARSALQFRRVLVLAVYRRVKFYLDTRTMKDTHRGASITARALRLWAPVVCRTLTAEQVRKIVRNTEV